MTWCPFATRLELQPESKDQPTITPTQLILHSIAAPWTVQRMYEYWRDSTNLESTFGVAYDGSIGQFLSTTTRADANYRANLRPDGTGAVSVETASNLAHTDPWTPEQVQGLIRLGVWIHETHGVPLRVCRTWDDPGYGYNRLFPEWSVSGTACPGDARVAQFHNVIFPGIVAAATTQEDQMYTQKYEQNATDVTIQSQSVTGSGTWTGLAFEEPDPAVLHSGPRTLGDTFVHLYFGPATDPATLVEGEFYLTDPDGSNPSAYTRITHHGGGGHQFHHGAPVPANKHLRFRVRVTTPDGSPVVLQHRVFKSDFI